MHIKSLEENTYSRIVSFVNKGKIKENIENYADAIVFYNKALDLYPKDENEYSGQKYLYELLGNCFQKQQNRNEAAKYFEKAYQCYEGPKDINLLLTISIVYNQLNNKELSKQYTDLCIKQGGHKLVEACMLLKSSFEEEVQSKDKTEVPPIHKVVTGKEYTFEEWKVYESEQKEIDKQNKNKKLFGLF
jgi:tetratricopeptide (TPR) repeat protein